jgi:short-subunit dehydrogenase
MSKVVAITGAAAGIGAAMARGFGTGGARLVLMDVDSAGLESLQGELAERGVDAVSIVCDVTDETACVSAAAAIKSQFGRLDVLVNNAGITHFSPIGSTDLSVLRRVMEVNFLGSVMMTTSCLDLLLASKGQVIAMSSVAGFCPLPLRSGYVASKHAMKGYFETLRSEYERQGLGVLVVCPFFVDTNIGRKALSGDGQSVASEAQETRTKGMVGVEGVADAIVVAAGRRKKFLPVARGARLAWALSRIAPRVLARISANRVFKNEEEVS